MHLHTVYRSSIHFAIGLALISFAPLSAVMWLFLVAIALLVAGVAFVACAISFDIRRVARVNSSTAAHIYGAVLLAAVLPVPVRMAVDSAFPGALTTLIGADIFLLGAISTLAAATCVCVYLFRVARSDLRRHYPWLACSVFAGASLVILFAIGISLGLGVRFSWTRYSLPFGLVSFSESIYEVSLIAIWLLSLALFPLFLLIRYSTVSVLRDLFFDECVTCGYDLRASVGDCPECDAAPRLPQPSTTPFFRMIAAICAGIALLVILVVLIVVEIRIAHGGGPIGIILPDDYRGVFSIVKDQRGVPLIKADGYYVFTIPQSGEFHTPNIDPFFQLHQTRVEYADGRVLLDYAQDVYTNHGLKIEHRGTRSGQRQIGPSSWSSSSDYEGTTMRWEVTNHKEQAD
jgi:hypothetical protein